MNIPDVSKSLLDISAAVLPGSKSEKKMNKSHNRNMSSFSNNEDFRMKSSSIVKPYMHYEKYKNKKFKEIEAQRRDVKL